MSLLARFGEKNVENEFGKFKRTISTGELYCDEDDLLILSINSEETVVIEKNVGYWTVIEGERIIVSHRFSPDHFKIFDRHGRYLNYGYVTKKGDLVYREGEKLLQEDPEGKITVLLDTLYEQCDIEYDEDSNFICITETHPLTRYYSNRVFNCRGEYLRHETKALNALDIYTDIAIVLTGYQADADSTINELHNKFRGQQRITLADLDHTIDTLADKGQLHTRSISGYHILKPILQEAYGDRDLSIVLTNLMRASQNGRFCRRNRHFITRKFALLLKKLYKAVGDQNFRYYTQSYKELNNILKDFQEG